MATTGKTGGSSTIWIIGSLIVIAGGIGAYFLLKKPKSQVGKSEEELKREEEERKRIEDENKKDEKPKKEKPKEEKPQKEYVAPKTFTFPFKTKAEGNAFRVWVNTKYPDYAKSIDLSKSGELNSYVEKAWVVYGAEYTKNPSLTGTTPTGTTPTGTIPANLSNDIDTIIKLGNGSNAKREHLLKQPAPFVKTWADSLKSTNEFTKNRFQWGNKVYRTSDGGTLLYYYPLNKNYWAKNNLKAYQTHNTKTSYSSVSKGTKLGKAKNMWATSDGLWFYMPDESYFYKWYLAKDVTSTPSSSFEGTNDHIEFSNFDNHLDLNL